MLWKDAMRKDFFKKTNRILHSGALQGYDLRLRWIRPKLGIPRSGTAVGRVGTRAEAATGVITDSWTVALVQ